MACAFYSPSQESLAFTTAAFGWQDNRRFDKVKKRENACLSYRAQTHAKSTRMA